MVGEGPLRTRRKEVRKKWVAVKREEGQERERASEHTISTQDK